MKWIDSLDVALSLLEAHPDVDPAKIRFTDLREWILALDDFDDDPNHCNERILEAIQACWINEY
ncbi:Fe-S cluster assembly protein IscX [Shewanella insulae]|uniref:Fe-S cluster assembly protein IscX n=1 Tax=Shewanella insulae TaxID=2681496 RepID=A0A6L7I1F7_9GAMM|nr:Fe-S cluster assembly protein IscX [Shewanella insulae]MCG9713622.1 Fe-S cluster assembly protein IscX [Shewanella insulae]MCG9737005.1 Fe-S cluster assembly protein IscX [Shewanella insulae]MCG9755828.1 Fe-S cluster assembly protein IscX [Shewanella insulae]MXR70362.1 Fe-S cluster assembly protein IscX [Shewanella insulae]